MKSLTTQLLALLNYQPLWRLALAVSALAILVLATVPGSVPLPPSPSDKFNHLIAFLELTLVARLGWPQLSLSSTVFALAGYGVAIELIQWPLSYREFSVADMVADSVGIFLGVALWRLLPRQALETRP